MNGLLAALAALALSVVSDVEVAPVPQRSPAVQRLRSFDLETAPRLRSLLPAVVPADADHPSVLVDPPGRALMAYHPPEFCDADAGSGWQTETVLLFGADGRWRRLSLDDLGLPAAAWPGWDTYGAGALSPDGRWWAGRSRPGVVLFDLRTGRHRLVDLDTNWVAEVRWRADSRSLVAATHPRRGAALRTHEVFVPGLRGRVGPFERWEHQTAAYDGRLAAVDQPRRPDGEFGRRADLVVTRAGTVAPEAVLRFDQAERPLQRMWWWDAETLLLATDREVLAWRPAESVVLRVSDLPEAAPRCYATVVIAVGASRRRERLP